MNGITNSNDFYVNGLFVPDDISRYIFMHITDDRAFDAFSSTCKRVREIAHSIPLYQFHPLSRKSPLVHFVQLNEDVNTLIPILRDRGLTPDEASRANFLLRYYNNFLIININQDDLLFSEDELSVRIYNSFEKFCFNPNEKIDFRDHKQHIEVFFNALLKKSKMRCVDEIKIGNVFHVFKKKYEEVCLINLKDQFCAFSDQPADSIIIDCYLTRMNKIANPSSRYYNPGSCTLFSDCGIIAMSCHVPVEPFTRTSSTIQFSDVYRDPIPTERFFRNALLKHSEDFKKYALECSNADPMNNQIFQHLKTDLKTQKTAIENEISELTPRLKNAELKKTLLCNIVKSKRGISGEISEFLDLHEEVMDISDVRYNNSSTNGINDTYFEEISDDLYQSAGSQEDLFDTVLKYQFDIGVSRDLVRAQDLAFQLYYELNERHFKLTNNLKRIDRTLERMNNTPEMVLAEIGGFYTELCIEVTESNEIERYRALSGITYDWQWGH